MAGKRQAEDQAWFGREIEASKFRDVRLRKRFGMVLERLWKGMGQTIPLACQDWANTKAAYRFQDNERVNEQDILSGHFQATAERFSVTKGPVLVLHDTTAFLYEREHPELVGYASSSITAETRRGLAKPCA
ncbi:transposase, partial [Paraburkholderia mimosarum]|uniref:IS4/Tn5 family transposase DNA-binding protein n=1 Tax=Paraburkholderia mimosarum TaxID=312026 RepID=UPI0039C0926D